MTRYALLTVGTLTLLWFAVVAARSETMIRTVPEGATLSYSVGGVVVQTMPLSAGTYRITVEPMATRAAPGHRPRPTRAPR